MVWHGLWRVYKRTNKFLFMGDWWFRGERAAYVGSCSSRIIELFCPDFQEGFCDSNLIDMKLCVISREWKQRMLSIGRFPIEIRIKIRNLITYRNFPPLADTRTKLPVNVNVNAKPGEASRASSKNGLQLMAVL